MPHIPDLLKDIRHVAYCYSSHCNDVPRFIPHVILLGINSAPQMTQEVEVGTSEIGDCGGHTTGPFYLIY
jgi:hypothetical protein